MFVGHAVLAFVLASLGAVALGWDRTRALQFGVVAAGFGVLPDVDMVYAPVGLLDGGGVVALANSFWGASTLVHRGVTHSIVVGAVAAVAFGALPRSRPVAGGLGGSLLVAVTATEGVLAGAIMGLFVGGGFVVAAVADRYGFTPSAIAAAGVVGLVSHPFGDLFTGTPPAMFYPFDVTVFADRVAPFLDPTHNLLLAFGVELAVIWTGILVVGWLTRTEVREAIGYRAGVGVGYAGVALVLVPPTMQTSYPFVFSALALGVVGVYPTRVSWREIDISEAVVTGLTAVTIGVIAYTVTYLVIGA